MDGEEPTIGPLVNISGVSFSDSVQVDEDVAVSGSLTNGQILSATDEAPMLPKYGSQNIEQLLRSIGNSDLPFGGKLIVLGGDFRQCLPVQPRANKTGEDWLGSFLRRHSSLSIRTPPATSLSRATSFNKHNVSMFFANLTTVYQRLNVSPGDIWNVDETGVTTVQVPNRIIAQRGIKSLGKITSAERGCEGDANPSGWMKEENFINHKLQPLDRSVYGPLKKYFNRACDNWLASPPGKTITIYDIPELLKTSLPLAATIENIQSGFRVSGISPLNENIFSYSEFSGSYVTDRPVHNSHDSGNSSACDVSTVTVPSTSNASNSLSIVEEVPIPDHNSVTVTHTLALQCSAVNTEQITITMPSPTRSLSKEYGSPSFLDETLNSVLDTELKENLKPPENVHPIEANVPPSVYNVNLPSTSLITPEEIRPFPKAAPFLANRRNIRKCKSTIYTDTPEKQNLVDMKTKRETFKKK
ncbi:hypothetical protein EVAR_96320_1 [Eumeta japonica]|uniref:ATP-dependent DNA helicase n=1 Tax=Eumeta variegata TaxID=151549 RepID=A0A4C1VV77_EUMVA|nr:hypothetical protein EVAR_96320_1 [Eumeta japonica]